jgi:hypothetical protein
MEIFQQAQECFDKLSTNGQRIAPSPEPLMGREK